MRHTVLVATALTLSGVAQSQTGPRSLIVSGGVGEAPVMQVNGRNYVEVEGLARITRGSLRFAGNQLTLTLGSGGQGASSASPTASQTEAQNKFSSAFIRAGIEAISTLREWHSALASTIENGYPVTREGLARYQGEATTNLQLAEAAATTNADHQGVKLIESAYQKMKQLSDKYIGMRANMTYIAPDALSSDPLNQSLVACGKAVGGMASTGQFAEEATCQ